MRTNLIGYPNEQWTTPNLHTYHLKSQQISSHSLQSKPNQQVHGVY